MKRKKGCLIFVLVFFLIIGAIGMGFSWWLFSNLKRDSGQEIEIEQAEEAQEEKHDVETIALFGVDSRSDQLGKGTRSDSIMLAEIDHDEKKIKLASIYRDSYVSIDDHGFDKINHAHSFGGPGLAVNTLNKNFDLQIQKYVTINFHGICELVDDLGGIEMTLTSEEASYLNKYVKELNRIEGSSSDYIEDGGTYLLDGTQALAYSRIRYTAGGDYRRAERQRAVLMKMFDKIKEMSPVELTKLVRKYMKEVNTNLKVADVLKYAYYAAQYSISDTQAFPTKLWGGKLNGIWYAVPVTLESNAIELHEYLYPGEEYTPSKKVKEISSQLEKIASKPNEVR